MTSRCWAVWACDVSWPRDVRVVEGFASYEEARAEAGRRNASGPADGPLYYAGNVSGDGPTPAGQCDYPEDGGNSPVPWGWREERQPEQTE